MRWVDLDQKLVFGDIRHERSFICPEIDEELARLGGKDANK